MGDLVSRAWGWLHGSNPDAWAAGAGWTTATVAVVAAIAAFRQVREARRLREEQAQPYVVAFMEASPASQQIIDLVVKNFGTTVARNVRIDSSPRLVRSGMRGSEVEDVVLFDVLPVLVPGQDWRTFWDAGTSRHGLDVPDRYEVTIFYEDSKGKAMEPTISILDWAVFKSRIWTEVYGVHHAAKYLKDIGKSMGKWGESGGGVKVYVRDGGEKDARDREEHAEMVSKLEELNDRLLPRQAQAEPDGEDRSGAGESAKSQQDP